MPTLPSFAPAYRPVLPTKGYRVEVQPICGCLNKTGCPAPDADTAPCAPAQARLAHEGYRAVEVQPHCSGWGSNKAGCLALDADTAPVRACVQACLAHEGWLRWKRSRLRLSKRRLSLISTLLPQGDVSKSKAMHHNAG